MDSTHKSISIWQPQTLNGALAFVRPDPLPLGDHYADRKTIFKSKPQNCQRICFFGESAAAGYLYTPQITPAKVLESQLLQICAQPQFEVIDLAMTNETLHGLVDKVESSLQLQPDLLVIFTGNNWTMLETPELSPYFPSMEARMEYARLLREEGSTGPINQASLRVLQKAAAAFAQIDKAARSISIPVILVIPEINLADWENRQAPLWLQGDKTAQWYALYQKTLQHLQQEDWHSAEESAWQMEELDAFTCPTTYRLLAKTFLGLSDTQKAEQALRAEVDSNRYPSLCFLGAPQINSGAKALQKKLAQHYGFSAVDLQEIFARHSGTAIPGKRLFLDYCHLTVEGIKVAMSAVSAAVLTTTEHPQKGISWERLLKVLPNPEIPPEADAIAKFGAAIHTAHRHLDVGEGSSILEYWCREALAAAPGILAAMKDFVLARMTQVPAVLTAAQQRNFTSPYKLTMQHGWKYDFLDAPVIKAIEAVSRIKTAKLMEHQWPGQQPIELIDPPFFLWNPVERFYPEVMEAGNTPQKAFFRAAWHESSFAFIGRPDMVLQLGLTLRLPQIPGWDGTRKGSVAIKINGQTIGVVKATAQWTKASFSIKVPVLETSICQITLCWPPLPACGDAAIEGAIARLERGMEADLHPVFGEVFSLKVTNGFVG